MEKRIGDMKTHAFRIDARKNINIIGEENKLEWPTRLFRMNCFKILKTLVGR
jgi:hypothetical protein